MDADALAAMEDLDGARGDPHVDLGADERVRNRIEKVMDLDVIVEIDPRAPPFRELPIVGGQGDEGVALDCLEQLASAQAEVAHRTLVHALHDERDGLVAFGEREERQRAQSPENVGLCESDAGLDLRLVPRLSRPRRQDADRIMRRHRAVGAVDLGIVEGGLVDAALQIVGNQQLRHAAEEAEHAHVRAGPVRQRLCPGRLGVGEVRGAEHADEYLRLADFAGRRIDDPDPLARIVDERLLPGDMVLAHHRRQPSLEAAKQIAEPAVAVALGMDLSVFLPEDRHRDARTLQLARQGRPVRLDPPPLAVRDPGAPEQPAFQSFVGDVVCQRPCQPGRRRPFQIVLDRRARHAQTSPDLARAHPIVVKSQQMSQLSHAQFPLRRHPDLLVDHRRAGSAAVAEPRGANAKSRDRLRWPASFRNGGRHQIGTAADIKSESLAGLRRNSHFPPLAWASCL